MKQGDYWYLFVSYAALQQTGGYQIREFRSKDITGPYVDEDGNTAISTTTIGSNWLGKTGIRLMASVEWSGNDNTNIEVAQGTTPHSWMKTALLCGLPHPLLQPRRRARSTCS